ncbi:MAG: hypothetical protein CO167_01385 [Candidatus Marinimicrobia bacterium CG_4_9_14_3_um_filter_48_9]|nr:MAG: hypothetical protein CO167_01385 [Candidatus Marinimicrobia bacterium CG_4_9_14_3_um_filter_48_9]
MTDKVHKELDFFKLVRRSLIAGLFLVIAFMTTILFFTDRLSDLIVGGANQFLESKLHLYISGEIEGSLFKDGLKIANFKLSEIGSDNLLISADEFNVGLHWSSVFKQNVILSHVKMNQAIIDSNLWKWRAPVGESKTKINLIFHTLSLNNMTVFLPSGTKSDSILVELYRGSGWLLDGIAYFKTDSGIVQIGWPLNQKVQFSGGASFDAASSGQLIDFGVQIAAGSALIVADWQGDSLTSNVQIPKFDLNQIINKDSTRWPVQQFTLSDIDIDLSRKAQFWTGDGVGNISINQHESKFDNAHLTWDSTGFTGNAKMTDSKETVQLSGRIHPNGGLEISGDVANLDLSQDFKKIPARDITGKFNVAGNKKSQHSTIHLTHFSIGSYQFDELKLRVTRDGGNHFTIDTLNMFVEGSQVALFGAISPDGLSLKGTVNLDDISKWVNVTGSSVLQGSADIDLTILGTLESPEIEGTFMQNDLGLSKRLTATGVGKFNVQKKNNRWEGDLVVQAEQGTVLGDSLSSLMLSADLTGDKITLRNLNIRSDRYILTGDGFISKDSIRLNRLNLMFNKLSLALAEPLMAYRENASDTTWAIPRSVISINRGGLALQGQISKSGILDLDVDGELISVSLLAGVLNLDFPLSGDISGQLTVTDKYSNPTITANLEWNKPVFSQLTADNLTVDGVLNNHQLQITQAEMTLNNSKAFLSGIIPVGFTKQQWELARFQPQLFTIKLTNYQMKDLLITKFHQTPIGGVVSGSMNIRGTAKETILDGDLSVKEGHFGKIEFNQGLAILNYQKGIISFDTMGVITNWGVASGSGYLSAFFDLRPDIRTPSVENPMDMTFKGNFSQLKFLSEYIGGLDDISGEFTGDMHLYGTYRNPIRDMKLRGHHAIVTMAFLDNKITDIHTEITMQNNIMTVNHFTGKMRYNERTVLQRGGFVPTVTKLFGTLVGIQNENQYKGDIQITGIGDFTSFFHPRFNIRLTGDEIYYRNIAGGVEAISDMNMTIEGQDTLRINAEMPVVNAIYYADFSSRQTYDVKTVPVTQTARKPPRYNLHTTFDSNLRIDNNYMSSEFDGDLYLLDYGDGHLRFSGTLDAIEGGKFYYLGNILTITHGTLSFDPVEFNPTMSFTVKTTIDGKEELLMLTGDLKEPQLSLDPESTTNLTMDDILTYLTLNQKISGGLTLEANSFRDPVSSYVGILATKELEKLGGQVFGLDIVDLKSGLSLSDTTRILLGQRISRNLKMTYETDFLLLQPNPDYQFGMEYRVNKNLSIIGKVDQDGLVDLRSRLRYNY